MFWSVIYHIQIHTWALETAFLDNQWDHLPLIEISLPPLQCKKFCDHCIPFPNTFLLWNRDGYTFLYFFQAEIYFITSRLIINKKRHRFHVIVSVFKVTKLKHPAPQWKTVWPLENPEKAAAYMVPPYPLYTLFWRKLFKVSHQRLFLNLCQNSSIPSPTFTTLSNHLLIVLTFLIKGKLPDFSARYPLHPFFLHHSTASPSCPALVYNLL